MVVSLLAGLDCSGDTFSVAVTRDGACLAECSGMRPRTHLSFLMPCLLDVCRLAGVALAALEGLAVTVGPGAFTGVRLGVLTARSLSQALGLALAPVPTLEALALNAPEGCTVVCAVDARRGEIYSAAYRVLDHDLEIMAEPAARSPEQLERLVAGLEAPLVLGNALRRYAPGGRAAGERLWSVRGSCVAQLGKAVLEQGRGCDWRSLEPVYLRPPDVQVHA